MVCPQEHPDCPAQRKEVNRTSPCLGALRHAFTAAFTDRECYGQLADNFETFIVYSEDDDGNPFVEMDYSRLDGCEAAQVCLGADLGDDPAQADPNPNTNPNPNPNSTPSPNSNQVDASAQCAALASPSGGHFCAECVEGNECRPTDHFELRRCEVLLETQVECEAHGFAWVQRDYLYDQSSFVCERPINVTLSDAAAQQER